MSKGCCDDGDEHMAVTPLERSITEVVELIDRVDAPAPASKIRFHHFINLGLTLVSSTTLKGVLIGAAITADSDMYSRRVGRDLAHNRILAWAATGDPNPMDPTPMVAFVRNDIAFRAIRALRSLDHSEGGFNSLDAFALLRDMLHMKGLPQGWQKGDSFYDD